MGVRFSDEVLCRASQRGLVIGGVDGDALLLEHPQATNLPDLLDDTPSPEVLAERLGKPNGRALVDEMLEIGILREDAPVEPSDSRPISSRTVVVSRSGMEFPGIARPARWLDRRIVPVICSWPGRLLLSAVVVGGVVALATGRPVGPTVSGHPALDALLGLAVMLVCSALHELAHAVALVHFGRTPRRAGFGFYWGGISFYVDSTEALTLPRRQRVTQALVGLAVDVVAIALLAIVAHLSTLVLVVVVAWRLAVVGVVDIVTNLLPILEVDGHWALADLVDEPELAPRARAALGRVLRRRPRGHDEPRWLAAYGAASLAGGVALLVGGVLVWWAVAHDLVAALFTGNPTDLVVGIILIGPVLLGLLISTTGLVLEVVLDPTTAPAGTPS